MLPRVDFWSLELCEVRGEATQTEWHSKQTPQPTEIMKISKQKDFRTNKQWEKLFTDCPRGENRE